MASAEVQCRICGGESFSTAHGLMVCNECGNQEENYMDLVDQEDGIQVDSSRIIITKQPSDETRKEPDEISIKEVKSNTWTTYEAYNCILWHWTRALQRLGASSDLHEVTFRLWVAYLQRLGVAFLIKQRRTTPRTAVKSLRDYQLLHSGAESVSGSSLVSYRRRKKKKKAKVKSNLKDSTLKRFKTRYQKAAVKGATHLTNVKQALTKLLSQSLNEYESSQCSEHWTSIDPSFPGTPKTSTSYRDEWDSNVEKNQEGDKDDSEVEGTKLPQVPRKQMRRESVVMNWIKHSIHTYETDKEEEEGEEEEEEEQEEEEEESDRENKKEEGESDLKTKEENTEDNTIKCKDDEDDSDTYALSTSTRSSTSKKLVTKNLRNKYKAKYKYKKLHRRVRRASESVTMYKASRLPFIVRPGKLLAILYLAVLLTQDNILLSDIIRWCREGHIPYMSAPYLLGPEMEMLPYDKKMFDVTKKLPMAQEIQAITGRLATFLSIQWLPLPATTDLLRKYVTLLSLPDQVISIGEKLLGLVSISELVRHGLSLPPVESLAMATIILVLKLYCGLDNCTEVMLSAGGAAVLAKGLGITPFSWVDWQRHVSRMVWVCCQIDAPAAFHWQSLHRTNHLSPQVFSRFFWQEAFWRVPRTARKKKTVLQMITEKLLRNQGLTLNEVLMQQPAIPPSSQALRGILEHLTHTQAATRNNGMHTYAKAADELLKESFASHSLDWFCEIDHLASELRESGFKVISFSAQENKKLGYLYRIQERDNKAANEGERKKKDDTTAIFIPHPLKNVWKIKHDPGGTWSTISPSLPSNFKWLLWVGSCLCETSEMQMLYLVTRMQNKIRNTYKSQL